MFEEIFRLGGTFAFGVVMVLFWYYVISRTGSF